MEMIVERIMKKLLLIIYIAVILSACAKVEKQSITIESRPKGANIVMIERIDKTEKVVKQELGKSPVKYEMWPPGHNYHTADDENDTEYEMEQVSLTDVDSKYTVLATKDGYFAEEKKILDYDRVFKTGKFIIELQKSPLWWNTTTSPAANEWVNLIVSPDITDVDMWQRVVDAVTKRFPDLKEYDFTSGYLLTESKVKTFTTSRGTFLLRSKFIATIMERDPLTYRLKIISEWSDRESNKWYPYPRVFKADAELVDELMTRFQAY